MEDWSGKDMSFKNNKNKTFVYLRVTSWLKKQEIISLCNFVAKIKRRNNEEQF